MHLSLPRIDSWTAVRELKDNPKTAHIPLLVLTAYILPGDRKRAIESGFDGYISKPINVVNFGESISKILNNKPGNV
jgi:two-component system cell cycle response regulator DivK